MLAAGLTGNEQTFIVWAAAGLLVIVSSLVVYLHQQAVGRIDAHDRALVAATKERGAIKEEVKLLRQTIEGADNGVWASLRELKQMVQTSDRKAQERHEALIDRVHAMNNETQRVLSRQFIDRASGE